MESDAVSAGFPAHFDTPRLHLRPVGEGDEALYCRLFTDPGVMRHLDAPLSVEAAQRAFQSVIRQSRRAVRPLQMWVLSERDSSADIGTLALMPHRDTADAVEIGAMLLTAGQGRGLAAEAQVALLDRFFSVPGPDLVWSRNALGHGAAIGVRLKLGFVRAVGEEAGDYPMRWEMTRQRWHALRGLGRDVVPADVSG